jgi:DNA repair exonuclease SbcCD nuclease subunit
VKFVHAADIHLDSPMKGLAPYPGAPVEAICGATRQAFESLIDLCLNEEADLLVIAGDVYDGDWKDFGTGLYLRSQLARLRESEIEVVMIHGNHDAASVITRNLSLPGIHVLSDQAPGSVVLEKLGIVVHGQSFPTRAVTENLAAAYPEPMSGYFNIGVLHTALGGYAEHDNYAPCQLDELINHGYGYWALGHVHQPSIVHADPPIVFAGVLQGRHIKEAGPKGATLVSVVDGEVKVEQRTLDHVRWERVRVDVGDTDTEADILEQVTSALNTANAGAEERVLACRIEVDGATPNHALVMRDRERLDSEVRALATELGPGQAWVERILWATEAPRSQVVNDDAVGETLRLLRETAADETALAELAESLKSLAVKLPAEVKLGNEGIDPADPETLARFLAEAEREVPSLLAEGRAA